MTTDEIFEIAWNELRERVDGATLQAGISLRETAQLYRQLASECRDRANGLEDEAEVAERANQ